jgi:hypothetical protein
MSEMVSVNVASLAEFKRFLRMPGATVQVIRNDWADPAKTAHPITPKAGYWNAKQIAKVQSNSVQFSTGGWLQFPKASNIRFEGDTVSICMKEDGSFREVLAYRLSRQSIAVTT